MDSLTIKLDEGMLKDIDRIIKEHRYSTKTEFVREALREKMTKIEKETLLKQIMALRGSSKTKTTDAKLHKIRDEAWKELEKKYST